MLIGSCTMPLRIYWSLYGCPYLQKIPILALRIVVFIKHDILKTILRKKIKDKDLLWLLDVIIDSADGVPIGNYLSQYFANIYLAYFDHFVKWILKLEKRNGSFKYSKLIPIEVLILSGMSFTIPIPLFGRESKRIYVGRQPS